MNQINTKNPITRQRDVQVATIADDTQVLRSRTWDRLKFEVEYSRQKGTTSNSYLIKGDKIALIDPPGQSFTKIYLETLSNHEWRKIDYIILQHVNPNRLATIKLLAGYAPQAQIICSKPAAQALKGALMFPQWKERVRVVRDNDSLDLGQGHQLKFIRVSTPRWADGLCTYDPQTKILYTDKFFGAHICDQAIFDDNWKELDSDRRFYFDCLHACQTKQLETALAKFAPLKSKIYAPAHGSLIKYSLSRLTYDYQQWCQAQTTQELKVALFYASAYGNTAIMANAIAQGLIQSDVAVELINCELASTEEMTQAIKHCTGFIIGSPTLGGHAPTQIQTALGIILANAAKTKLAGVFGSYGWSGEAIAILENKLRDAHYNFGFESLRVRFNPTTDNLKECIQAGKDYSYRLKKIKRLRSPRQGITETQIDRTEQAVGRVTGSSCVLTSRNQEDDRGVLTSWVSQATFNPPGIMIAAPENDAELLDQPGAKLVLNILREDRNVRRNFIPHRSKSLSNLATKTANNGCAILEDALAYLECTVQSRLTTGDRSLIYATVTSGEVLEGNGMTAIQHRKSGSHY